MTLTDTHSFPIHLSTYKWRPISEADIPAIVLLTKASAVVDQTTPASAAQLGQIFAILEDQVETNTLTAVAPDGTLAALALAFIMSNSDENLAIIDTLIHPEHRGKEIGQTILAWIEAATCKQFTLHNNGFPKRLQMSCSIHQQDQIDLYKNNGFSPKKYAYKMQRDLKMPIPNKPFPQGLQLISWQKDLDNALMLTFNKAFNKQEGVPKMNQELWQKFFIGVPQFRDDLTYLAMDDNTIVGFCVNWVNVDKNTGSSPKEGWIEALGVIPAWRGRGLASSLLTHSLKQFAAEGLEEAGLDVDTQNPTGALRLYQNLGFTTVKETVTLSKTVQ